MKCDRSRKRDLMLKCYLHDYRANKDAAALAGESNPEQYARENTKSLPYKRMSVATLVDEMRKRFPPTIKD